jgi:hypothetical protein
MTIFRRKMVIRPKYVAVTEYNIQTSVALDGNPELDYREILMHVYLKLETNFRAITYANS